MHTLASTMWYEVQCPWLFTTLVGVYTLARVLVLHIIIIYIIHDVYTENGDNITTRPYIARWL